MQFLLDPGERFKQVTMTLDGKSVPVKYDDTTGLVSYTPPEPLAPGTHKVKLTVDMTNDRNGRYNPRISEFSFTVAKDAMTDFPAPTPEQLLAVEYLNQIRQAAGLPLFTHNQHLAVAAMSHAHWLTKNRQTGADNGESGHWELEGTPGFTGVSPGDRTRYFGYGGGASEVLGYTGAANEAIDRWLHTLYHRISLVQPGNTEMGFGQAGQEDRVNGINMGPGTDTDTVTLWPYSGQRGVPVQWDGGENPSPFRLYPGVDGDVGYTVTATWGRTPKSLTLKTYSLKDGAGRKVDVMIFYPGQDDLLRDTVAMIPYKPLAPNTTYTAQMAGTVDLGDGAKPYSQTWSFTTGAAPVTFGALSTRPDRHTLKGAGFRMGMRVYLNGLPVANLEVRSDGEIAYQVPAAPAGTSGRLTITVVTPEGDEYSSQWKATQTFPEGNPLRPVTARINAGGETLAVKAQAHTNGTVLLPPAALRQLGLIQTVMPATGRVFWGTWQGRWAAYDPNRTIAMIGGKRVGMPMPPQEINGELHVPAAFVEAFLGVPKITIATGS